MRKSVALACVALCSALVAVPPAAGAVAAECQGKPVTIMDADGGTVEGTEAADVILVSGGGDQNSIVAKGGSDTICLSEGVVFAGTGHDSVFVAGDVEQEYLDIRDAENLDVTIGPGGGFVQLVGFRKGHGTLDVSSGAYLRLIGEDRVSVDLEDDVLQLERARFTLLGNPGIFAIGRDVDLVGDHADNNLAVNQFSCQITMKGGRGDDDLTVAGSDGDLPFAENCGSSPSVVFGQRGNDVLQGRGGPDILFGGPGSDEALGGRGSDVCKAERERNCER